MLNIFLIAMLLATLLLLTITRMEVKRLINRHHAQKVSFFIKHPIQQGDIVFIGDSLTDGARWDEMLPGLPVKNRGINADTTAGVLARLDEVIAGNPAKIFVLIGTNDLPWYEYKADDEILDVYSKIVKQLREELPECRTFVQSLLPRHLVYANRIIKLNKQLQALAEENGCTYIDLFHALVDSKGGLRKDLTNDDLHLLGDGYLIWAETIRQHVSE